MVRSALFVFWVAAALVVLLPLLRRASLPPERRPVALRDELVKDPVCQTYVVRSRAVRSDEDGQIRYFCSAECARRYAAGV